MERAEISPSDRNRGPSRPEEDERFARRTLEGIEIILSYPKKARVDLGGYMVWSLMDNFDWTFGYTKRRVVKESGRWYSNVIASGEV